MYPARPELSPWDITPVLGVRWPRGRGLWPGKAAGPKAAPHGAPCTTALHPRALPRFMRTLITPMSHGATRLPLKKKQTHPGCSGGRGLRRRRAETRRRLRSPRSLPAVQAASQRPPGPRERAAPRLTLLLVLEAEQARPRHLFVLPRLLLLLGAPGPRQPIALLLLRRRRRGGQEGGRRQGPQASPVGSHQAQPQAESRAVARGAGEGRGAAGQGEGHAAGGQRQEPGARRQRHGGLAGPFTPRAGRRRRLLRRLLVALLVFLLRVVPLPHIHPPRLTEHPAEHRPPAPLCSGTARSRHPAPRPSPGSPSMIAAAPAATAPPAAPRPLPPARQRRAAARPQRGGGDRG